MYIAALKVENSTLKDQNEYLTNMVKKSKAATPDDFNGDDNKRYYTGLPSFVALYSKLGATCPIDHVITKADDECPLLDKVVFVCCA